MDTRDQILDSDEHLIPSYSDEEEESLAKNLYRLSEEIHRGEHRDERFDVAYLCTIHRRIFEGVRDHAGRCRAPGFGSEHKTFGPNRSAHRNDVESELRNCFDQARRSLRSLDDNRGTPDYAKDAIHIAVWLHAEVVRIHPFEDGNGRSSRALMNSFLVRAGLHPVSMEASKETYCDCLNRFFTERDITLLRDLVIRLYIEQLPSFE